MGDSDDEPSLLTGSAGVGMWLAINITILLSYIPSQPIQVFVNGPNKKLNFLFIIIIFLIASFVYYKWNNRWKKITEYYEQKSIKRKLLIFIVMWMIAMVGMPIGIKLLMELITK